MHFKKVINPKLLFVKQCLWLKTQKINFCLVQLMLFRNCWIRFFWIFFEEFW